MSAYCSDTDDKPSRSLHPFTRLGPRLSDLNSEKPDLLSIFNLSSYCNHWYQYITTVVGTQLKRSDSDPNRQQSKTNPSPPPLETSRRAGSRNPFRLAFPVIAPTLVNLTLPFLNSKAEKNTSISSHYTNPRQPPTLCLNSKANQNTRPSFGVKNSDNRCLPPLPAAAKVC